MRQLAPFALGLAFVVSPLVACAADTAMGPDPCPPGPVLSATDLAVGQALVTPGEAPSPPKAPPEELAQRKAQAAKDWPNLCHYRAANAELKAPVKVVFMGDSITELWGLAEPGFFTNGVVDRGVSGQTSSQMLARFYADVIALHPRAVHLLAGVNDIAGNTGPTTEEDYKNNIRAMTELARAHDIEVVIGSIIPADHFWWAPQMRPAEQIKALNQWLRAFAKEHGFTFIDYYSALATPAGGMPPALANDGVHPNRDGFAVMTRLAQGAVKGGR